MALNYSHMPLFSAHTSEDNLWSPIFGSIAEGVTEKNQDVYGKPCHANRGELDDWNFGSRRDRDRVNKCCSQESNSKDILDLLPSDPFGMDIESTFTAITGWLEDLEVDYGRASEENFSLFAGWNMIWKDALKFQPFPGNFLSNQIVIQSLDNYHVDEKHYVGTHSYSGRTQFDEKSDLTGNVNQYEEDRDTGGSRASFDFGFQSSCDNGGFMCSTNETTSCSSDLKFEEEVEGVGRTEGVVHDALNFALSRLGLKDLLSVERVCKSLRSSVRDGFWLWMNIHIDRPLSEKITDDLLLQLTCRARGNLQCLTIVECSKITDDGIRRVLETNPRLSKLFLPGCSRVTIGGMLNNIRTHNSNQGVPGITHLRISHIFGVTRGQFEELKLLLGTHALNPENQRKPHYYNRKFCYLPFTDDRAIDIDMCPMCEEYRLVYDCPAEGCRVKDNMTSSSQACRACRLCVPRCAHCGRCVRGNEYEETFNFDLLCLDCFRQTVEFRETRGRVVAIGGFYANRLIDS